MLDMIQALGGQNANLSMNATSTGNYSAPRPAVTPQPIRQFLTPEQTAQMQALQGTMDPRRWDHLQTRLDRNQAAINGLPAPHQGGGHVPGMGGGGMGGRGGPPGAPQTSVPPQGNPALPPQPVPQANPWQAPVNQMIAPPQNMVGQRYGVAGLNPGTSPYDLPTY